MSNISKKNKVMLIVIAVLLIAIISAWLFAHFYHKKHFIMNPEVWDKKSGTEYENKVRNSDGGGVSVDTTIKKNGHTIDVTVDTNVRDKGLVDDYADSIENDKCSPSGLVWSPWDIYCMYTSAVVEFRTIGDDKIVMPDSDEDYEDLHYVYKVNGKTVREEHKTFKEVAEFSSDLDRVNKLRHAWEMKPVDTSKEDAQNASIKKEGSPPVPEWTAEPLEPTR